MPTLTDLAQIPDEAGALAPPVPERLPQPSPTQPIAAPLPPPRTTPTDGSVELPGTAQTPLVRGETRSAAGNILRRVPQGREALDVIANGVEYQESRHHHTDSTGGVLTSRSGALGVMQLMPSTARDLGVDPTNEEQNRAGGKKYLGQLYDKYGNWDDTLAAYNAGPKRVDDWIAAGRPESGKAALPEETRAYVPSVLSHAGYDDISPTSIVAAKRRVAAADLADIPEPGGEATTTRTPAGRDLLESSYNRATSDSEVDPYSGEPSQPSAVADALMHGVRRGLQELVTGPTQLTLEQVAPEMARKFTQAINDFEDRFEAPKEHPIPEFVGRVIGTTLGIVGGGALLGGIKTTQAVASVVPKAFSRLGMIGSSTATGVALGTTSYNRDPEETSRIVEGVFGGVFGGLVAGVGKAVMAGARHLADTRAYNDFISTLRDVVGDLTPSTTRLKDNFLERYQRLWDEKNEKYTFRNAAGQEITPGFPRDEISRATNAAIAGTREAGVAPTPTTRAVAAAVDRELGGPEARALQAQHEQAVKDYESEVQDWQKTQAQVLKGTEGWGEAARTHALRTRIAEGLIPAPPVHPGEFEAPPVTAEQYSAAVQAVNRAWARSRRDKATQTQLTQIKREMEAAAKSAAEQAGLDVAEFMRRAREAGTFYKSNIVPIMERYGFKKPEEIRGNPNVPFSGIAPAKFYDEAARLIEGHDMAALRSFKQMVGPAAEDDLVKIAAHRMLQRVERASARPSEKGREGGLSAEAVVNYVRDHKQALEELVGHDGVTRLQGYANISSRLINNPMEFRELFHSLTSHRWMQALGVAEIGMGAMEGQPRRIGIGVGMALAPWAGNLVYRVIVEAAKLPGVIPIVRRAARTQPDSKAMDAVMGELTRRVRVTAATTARLGAPVGGAIGGALGVP